MTRNKRGRFHAKMSVHKNIFPPKRLYSTEAYLETLKCQICVSRYITPYDEILSVNTMIACVSTIILADTSYDSQTPIPHKGTNNDNCDSIMMNRSYLINPNVCNDQYPYFNENSILLFRDDNEIRVALRGFHLSTCAVYGCILLIASHDTHPLLRIRRTSCRCRLTIKLGPMQSTDATYDEIFASPTHPAANMTFTDISVITVVISFMLFELPGLYVHTRQVFNACMYKSVLSDYGRSGCTNRQPTRFNISTNTIIGIYLLSRAQSSMFYVLGIFLIYFLYVSLFKDPCNTHWRLITTIPLYEPICAVSDLCVEFRLALPVITLCLGESESFELCSCPILHNSRFIKSKQYSDSCCSTVSKQKCTKSRHGYMISLLCGLLYAQMVVNISAESSCPSLLMVTEMVYCTYRGSFYTAQHVDTYGHCCKNMEYACICKSLNNHLHEKSL